MAKAAKTAITPTRAENYPEWYQQVVRAADLAENSPVRGCMVIKPWGCALWENMQRILDDMFKATGHKNAYFPLLIPKRFLEKEAEHVEGFAKECAVVTHHRLEEGPDGGLVPAGELEEPLVIRPTSEMIIGDAFSRWIESYRDLPLLINQWANVVRWEMRTRLFLRTSEFLWQEGHTAHATEQEAREHTIRMLNVYATFARDTMAMPVITGEKTAAERFPGAVETFCIEGMMQDRKALQAGTSHFLGQNFSKAQDIEFLDENGERLNAWTTSWGVSTRLIGGLIMTHADDDGLVLPPRLAPVHVVIMPITFKADDPEKIMNYCHKIADDLRVQAFHGRHIEVEIDDRDIRGGEKNWSWVKKGVPIRIEVGPRDMADDAVFMARRDRPAKDKKGVARTEFVSSITSTLEDIQQTLLRRATEFRDEHTHQIDTEQDFRDFFTAPAGEPTPIHAGFAMTHFSGDSDVEEKIKNDLGVTVRCIPTELGEPGTCPFTGKPSAGRVVWAKSY
ncbi:MAG: proline--tRNA ligase [Phycisphaerales bacterium]|nr:proline--tRNA ligase [Phycisphaerales bacterium]|tara:strand:+ start:395 stop:1915 length:1521 start_codon:yes stop_codon:yes gene_type:complete